MAYELPKELIDNPMAYLVNNEDDNVDLSAFVVAREPNQQDSPPPPASVITDLDAPSNSSSEEIRIISPVKSTPTAPVTELESCQPRIRSPGPGPVSASHQYIGQYDGIPVTARGLANFLEAEQKDKQELEEKMRKLEEVRQIKHRIAYNCLHSERRFAELTDDEQCRVILFVNDPYSHELSASDLESCRRVIKFARAPRSPPTSSATDCQSSSHPSSSATDSQSSNDLSRPTPAAPLKWLEVMCERMPDPYPPPTPGAIEGHVAFLQEGAPEQSVPKSGPTAVKKVSRASNKPQNCEPKVAKKRKRTESDPSASEKAFKKPKHHKQEPCCMCGDLLDSGPALNSHVKCHLIDLLLLHKYANSIKDTNDEGSMQMLLDQSVHLLSWNQLLKWLIQTGILTPENFPTLVDAVTKDLARKRRRQPAPNTIPFDQLIREKFELRELQKLLEDFQPGLDFDPSYTDEPASQTPPPQEVALQMPPPQEVMSESDQALLADIATTILTDSVPSETGEIEIDEGIFEEIAADELHREPTPTSSQIAEIENDLNVIEEIIVLDDDEEDTTVAPNSPPPQIVETDAQIVTIVGIGTTEDEVDASAGLWTQAPIGESDPTVYIDAAAAQESVETIWPRMLNDREENEEIRALAKELALLTKWKTNKKKKSKSRKNKKRSQNSSRGKK